MHQITQGVAESRRETASTRLHFDAAASDPVGFGRVEGGCVALGVLIALALDGVGVQHEREIHIFDGGERLDERRYVVPIDWPHVKQSELFEPRVFVDDILGDFAEAMSDASNGAAAGYDIHHALGGLLHRAIGVADPQPIEVGCNRALRPRDTHAVVIEDDEELSVEGTGVIEPFHRQAIDDAGITDECDGSSTAGILWRPTFASQRVAAGHAGGRRDGGAGVTDHEEVVIRFAGIGKSTHAAFLPQFGEHRIAARQQFVRIALMPDIKEQSIVAEVEDAV